ncbi:MAG: helix-hairpin-helix domain-containing protein [Leptolyngbyaceae cyanobacterium CSU_1_3]|nr:helix-hairpin-helix domain-containing protein [Leptolyngbyaceae cyanobacterium CSU_1_3]
MSVLRFLALLVSAAFLSVMISCSTQTPTPKASAPAAETSSPTSSPMGGMAHSSKQININTAILSELDKLEAKLGIPALSNKIQASRPYGNVEELVSKKVIDQAQFDQIKDMVTIVDIQLTGEAKDVDYMTKLGLMKGHLIVAKELLDLQQPDQAEPHIGHPVEEIYADVEDQLNERGIKEFKTPLIALQDLVKAGAKDGTKVGNEFKTSMQAVEGAIAALPENQRTSPAFVLQVINGLLDTANSEYGAAIADGKISQEIEYQDSRGFVIYANDLYKGIASQMAKDSPDADKTITTTMTELAKAWPSVVPPAAPVKTVDEVSALVKTVETAAQKSMKPAS